jgi:hypothetical protein
MLISKKGEFLGIFANFFEFFAIFSRIFAVFCGFLGIFGRFFLAQIPHIASPDASRNKKSPAKSGA